MADVVSATASEAPSASARAVKLIDCDVHAQPAPAMLTPYMSERARRYIERYGRQTPSEKHTYPRARGSGNRLDAWPQRAGVPPGGDPELLRSQLLDEWDIDYAVLEVMASLDSYDEPAVVTEVASAVNDWLVAEWLDFDERLRAAIVVAHEYPAEAIAEIERRAADRRFVAVFMPAGLQEQLGSRKYWPIYEAATGLGLPIAFHTGGYTSLKGAGPQSYYLGYHVHISCAMQSQLASMVAGGVFEAIPDLRVILTECGLSWATSLRWSLDAAWELMGEDHPQVKRRPSEYIRDHVWFTTQPIEEPDDPKHLVYAIEEAQLEDRLVFATDYPHWDFDSPAQALPRTISKELRAAIFAGNALDLYGLPREVMR
jgi:predicted TIM-barrel fold metal-dependent hydrolase